MSTLVNMPWTPDMAMDWAVLIQGRAIDSISPEEVRTFYDHYRLTQGKFQTILNNPQFQKEVHSNLDLLNDEGFVFSQKAAITAGMILERLTQRAMGGQLEAKEEITLLAKAVEFANLNKQVKETQKAKDKETSAQGFVLNMNFSSEAKGITIEQPPLPLAQQEAASS